MILIAPTRPIDDSRQPSDFSCVNGLDQVIAQILKIVPRTGAT